MSPTKTKKQLTVAQYIDQLITMSPKTQKEIAAEVGYEKPNVITMIKQGTTKLPLNKVGVFAKALNSDPVHLLRLTMSEYMPGTWAAIEDLLGSRLISGSELELIKGIRHSVGEVDIDVTDARIRELARLVKEWAAEDRRATPSIGRDMRRSASK